MLPKLAISLGKMLLLSVFHSRLWGKKRTNHVIQLPLGQKHW